MTRVLSAILELSGLAVLAVGLSLLALWLGLAVAGVGLVLVGLALDPPRRK